MNEYGLDYPLFYKQLYHILEPSLFMMKYNINIIIIIITIIETKQNF